MPAIQLPHIKARITRLQQLEEGLSAEVDAWGGESPLLQGEIRQYLDAIEAAVAGLFDARETLEDVVERLEESRPPAG